MLWASSCSSSHFGQVFPEDGGEPSRIDIEPSHCVLYAVPRDSLLSINPVHGEIHRTGKEGRAGRKKLPFLGFLKMPSAEPQLQAIPASSASAKRKTAPKDDEDAEDSGPDSGSDAVSGNLSSALDV